MKSEVYSWRLDPELKGSLEHAARERQSSIAALLEEIVRSWLSRETEDEDDNEIQRRLHAQARQAFGTLESGDERLATEATTRLRQKLRGR